MKKFRLLSFLCLLMLFATSSYASIPLTRDMWQGNNYCSVNINTASDVLYGYVSPDANNYADLTYCSKLVLTITNGSPRAYINMVQNEAEFMTHEGNTWTYDLEAIRARYGYVHLNGIKAASYTETAVASSMEIVRSEITGCRTNNGAFNELRNIINNTGSGTIEWNCSNWGQNARFQFATNLNGNPANTSLGILCEGNYNNFRNYFEVTFSPNIMTTQLSVQQGTVTIGDDRGMLHLTNIQKVNSGSTLMTVKYKGSRAFEPFEKSYTIYIKADANQPRIIWVTSWNDHITAAPNPSGKVTASEAGNTFSGQALGNVYIRRYLQAGKGSVPDEDVLTYHTDNIFLGYNDKANFLAIPLKAGVTNEQLEQAGLVRVPYINGNDEHWTILGITGHADGTDNNYWRPYHLGNLLYQAPSGQNIANAYSNLTYEITSNASSWECVTNTGGDNSSVGGTGAKSFNVYVENVPSDSVGVTAKLSYNGGTITSTTYFKVVEKKFNMSFVPKEGEVAENCWIMPYVKFPDLKLSDFKKIWVTIEDGSVVSVVDAASLYNDEYGRTGNVNNIPQWISWKWSDYKKDANGNNIPGTQYPIITGIHPKVFGQAGMAGDSTTITIHIDSPNYFDTEATWKVKVVPQSQMAFHFEMNHGDTNNDIKTITMVEGDFIYMPGIIGNPNGNDSYSRSRDQQLAATGNEFRAYAYSIKNGTVEMNWDPYFYGEGVADYFFTGSTTPNAIPTFRDGQWRPDEGGFFRMIPGNGSNTAVSNVVYPTIIFKEVGLGNYYRNDSLMIYALHPTNDFPCYLWAQDAQTGYACKPIRIKVVPRTIAGESASSDWTNQSIEKQKMEAMRGMTYPFTWDFEHMDVSDLAAIEQDATNGGNGNGGTYWRGRWDADPQKGETVLRTPKTTYKDYYQYNGGFNADHDDKDNNGNTEINQVDEITGTDEYGNPVTEKKKVSGMRQRWFKDIVANGKYLNMFKGLMLNIAGLDYWQQKYTRFNVSKKPNGGIVFEGNTHYLSLPGFGICGSNNKMADGTRQLGKLSMPGPDADGTNIKEHVQFNTNDNVTKISDFQTSKSYNGDAVTYTSNIAETKKNHKVKFVIKAAGSSGRIYIGGKSMMLNTNERNKGPRGWDPAGYNGEGTEIGENGTKFDGRNRSTVNNPDIALITTKSSPKTYVVELDPWDEDLQEQIYLALRDVTIYWMGITTEPRNMRSDYEVFTYSYPKDIDMEKTNQVMGILTQAIKDEETDETGIQFEARYASKYNRKGQLVATKIPDYKFGAYEGVFIYPNKQLSKMSNFNARNYGNPTNRNFTGASNEDLTRLADISDVTIQDNKVIQIALNSEGKARVDQDGNYIYEEIEQDHTYSYLPVYFIANAENMPTYEDDENHGFRGRELRMDMDGINASTGKDNGSRPEIDSEDVDYNARKNKLKGQPYSRWIPQDYYSNTDSITITSGNTGGNGNYRWIPLTMTNKFMLRYLTNDTEGNKKALGELVRDSQGNFVNKGSDIYYKLIGPEVVRFYRTFVANTPKGRRAHIVLTWHEYNVNTNGKSGISNDYEDEFPWEDPEKENTGSGSNQSTSNASGAGRVLNVKVVFAERVNNEEENLVSEDGGFPDGIEEVEQIEKEAKIYNLNGVRVTSPNKGVYIYNGRKVIIK